MIEMTLSSRHRIRNSNPGGLRPSTLPQEYVTSTLRSCSCMSVWHLTLLGEIDYVIAYDSFCNVQCVNHFSARTDFRPESDVDKDPLVSWFIETYFCGSTLTVRGST